MSLKIGPVGTRAPVKLTIMLAPETHDALIDYAAIHARENGREITSGDLAAMMIARFLKTDAGFRRARKALRQSPAARE